MRNYENDDLVQTAQLWRDSWVSTGLATSEELLVDKYLSRLSADRISGWRIRLACEGDEILGLLAYQPEDSWLRQLFIKASAQGRGVGTILLNVAKMEMQNGFWLRTDAANLAARRFYERRGLRRSGEKPHPVTGNLTAVYCWP